MCGVQCTDFMTDLLSSLDSKIRGWSQSPDKKRLRQRMSKVGQLLVLGNVLSSGVTKGPADPAVRGGAILGGRQIVV